MQVFSGATSVQSARRQRGSPRTTSSTTSSSSSTPSSWSSIRRLLLTTHFVILALLWDGSLNLVCPTAYAQIRGAFKAITKHGRGSVWSDGAAGGVVHHEDDGHHVIADGPDPSQKMHHDEGHDHHDKKNAMPGRSSDVSVKMIVFFLISSPQSQIIYVLLSSLFLRMLSGTDVH